MSSKNVWMAFKYTIITVNEPDTGNCANLHAVKISVIACLILKLLRLHGYLKITCLTK